MIRVFTLICMARKNHSRTTYASVQLHVARLLLSHAAYPEESMNIHPKHIVLLAAIIAILQGPSLLRAENGQAIPPLGAPAGEQQENRSQRSRSATPRADSPTHASERRQRTEQRSEIPRASDAQRVPGHAAAFGQGAEERSSRPRPGQEAHQRGDAGQQQTAPGRINAEPARPPMINTRQPESRSATQPREERDAIRGIQDGGAQPRRERPQSGQPRNEQQLEHRSATQPREERGGVQRIQGGETQPRHERPQSGQPRHDAPDARRHEPRGEDRNRFDRERWERETRERNRHDNDRRDFDRRDHDRRRDWDHRPHHVDRVYHHLPPRHDIFHHHGERYHFSFGRYYRLTPLGFVLVRPPVGMVVLSLPIGFRTVISAGFTYYAFGDIYYRRVPAGYEVVQPVRAVDQDYPEQVMVDIDLLNVRYGPDEDEDVIAQVSKGMILKVLGAAPGWLYIEVEGEDIQGWIMEHYVVNVSESRG